MFRDSKASVVERAGRDAPNLEVVGLNPIRCEVLLIRGLFIYLFSLYKADFLSGSRQCLRSVA